MIQNQTQYESFWFKTANNKLCVDTSKLSNFLTDVGFGLYKSTESRLVEMKLFLNDDGILKPHNNKNVKRFVRKFIESIPESEFNSVFKSEDDDEYFRRDILALWKNFTFSKENDRILSDLDIFCDDDFDDIDHELNMFKDSPETAHILFKNGVVKITKDSIELLPQESIKDEGAVWESEIRNHNIELNDKDDGLFAKFFTLAMYRQNNDIKDAKDWTEEYELTDSAKEELTSLRTAYGYLIHNHNTPEAMKLIFFIDENSEAGRCEGGNGKSLVMESIQYYKNKAYQDGKKMSADKQFQFSNVDFDTKFLFIDDITQKFDFESLYSMVTNDMEIENKNKDKFIIPKEKKPKMGITSNYVLSGTGQSDERRQHIVEFGSYWNRMNQEGESTSDKKHLGSALFNWKKDDAEWMSFFNFGFRCVQQYLRTGLQQSSSGNYKTKSIKLLIEGEGSNGQGTQWLIDWVMNDRLEIDNLEISEDDLYQQFRQDNFDLLEESGGVWSREFFRKALWILVDNQKGWYYNQHLARNGNGQSARRWLKGARGNQTNWLKITTDFDKEWKQYPVAQGGFLPEVSPEKERFLSDDTDEWIREFEEAI